ncbi:UPF0415 protein C7orf25 homolog isoform X2 [Penaeus japonicus]|nr:UPF0415 protein C7orf25 homolog isoform X2 [Penaeus japonicus]XP_042868581.1 UPF0415 protein C7orf25 homolog isoform X2 [Penaeus japonicus]XP_042868582.1 UPF0415 protein C7orf25 homolog isoform X2 [Penaeus japonicus]XP_042868583.1 UPF0415 protein C7orf25 homolog isoform X2 [Penaeus japonicus]
MAVELAHKKIDGGVDLLQRISKLNERSVDGASKLRRRVQAEIKCLTKKLEDESELKEEHIQCSNLGQLEALADVASEVADVTGVLRTFSIGGVEKIVVDVVADKGRKWIKVILRNPKALHLAFITRGRGASKPLDKVAEDFLICAELNQIFYSPPKVEFWFCSGVSEGLAKCLEDSGVLVKGTRIPDEELGLPDYSMPDSDTDSENCSSEDYSEESEGDSCSEENQEICRPNDINFPDSRTIENTLDLKECSTPTKNISKGSDESSTSHDPDCQSENNSIRKSSKEITTVNLDVTAMIAYVSATSNGQAHFWFQDRFLTEQAEWERKNPVKKVLDGYFEGRELMACQEAVDHFTEIVNIIGGEGEKSRAKELVSRLTIVPGQDPFQERVKLGGKVRLLSRMIFGTSEAHRAVTVTSNQQFVRSVENQGIRPAVFFHEPRALTEQKQDTAVPL